MHTELGRWRRAWRRVGKATVDVEVEADVVEEEEGEGGGGGVGGQLTEEEKNNCDTIYQPSPGRWGNKLSIRCSARQAC